MMPHTFASRKTIEFISLSDFIGWKTENFTDSQGKLKSSE